MNENISPFNFDDIPLPGDVGVGETLSSMLAEGHEIVTRGMEFISIPPTIRELEKIFPLLNHLQEMTDNAETMHASIELAKRLLRVKLPDGGLRCATSDEIADHFTLTGLSNAIRELISEQGFDTDNSKN